jgi:UDP-N-acetylmuramyl pentapeptide synthase
MIRAFGDEAPLSIGEGLDRESYASAISGAAGAALAAGFDLAEIASALEGFEGLGGRMKETRLDGIHLLDNSNSGLRASGVEAALELVKKGGKLALVVGEEAQTVCEGMDIPDLIEILSRHREEIDLLILVGERLKPYVPELSARFAPDLDSGLAEAKASLEEGGRIISCVKCFR